MRRFELKDAKSNKFWEIHAEGVSLTTRWGRIGTAGQTKTKEFGDTDKASVEMNKQIASKVAKGYAEVKAPSTPVVVRRPAEKAASPVEESTTTPPEAAPTSPDLAPESPPPTAEAQPSARAAVPLPDEDAFEIPSTWKSRLHPRRGSPFEVSLPSPPSWDEVKKAMKTVDRPEEPPVDAPLKTLEQLGRVAEQARTYKYEPGRGVTLLLRWVLCHRGLADALEVALGLRCMNTDMEHPSADFRDLRIALARASDAEREAAIARLDVQAQTRPASRAMAFYLIPEHTEWAFDDMADVPHPLMPHYAASIPDPKLLRVPSYYSYFDGLLETLTAEFGPRAVPFLSERIQVSYDAEGAKSAARALLRIPSEGAVDALLEASISERAVRALLPDLFERFPQRTLRLALSRPGHETMAKMWVFDRPEVADAIILSHPEYAGPIEKIRSSGGSHLPEADPASLPRFFREPPWTRKLSKIPAVKVAPPAPEGLEVKLSPSELATAEAFVAAGERTLARNQTFAPGCPHHLIVWKDAGFPTSGPIVQNLVGQSRYWFSKEEVVKRALAMIHLCPAAAAELIAHKAWSQGIVALASAPIAEHLLEGISKKTVRPVLFAWLERHPEMAAKACLHFAFAGSKKVQPAAQRCLALLAERGHTEVVKAQAEAFGEELSRAVEVILERDATEWLPKKVPSVPGFASVGLLPRPALKGGETSLGAEGVETLIRAFALSTLEDPYAGIEVAKELLDPDGLAQFAWELFEQWRVVGADAKGNWTLAALGVVGNDAVAHRLAPLVRAWPGESQHARAVMGLDVLLSIGTDVALMHLDGIAQKVKFKGIKTAAGERIEALAEQLGLTREELADRLVPTLDLEPDGTLELDYGPRKFRVGFDEALRPFVEDESGKRLKTLPKPGAKDDPLLAPAASEQFKNLKKTVKTVATVQIRRLENAMSVGRRWASADYRRFIVEHPVLVHLARRLVWVWEDEGQLAQTFRITEDSSFADCEDDGWALPDSGFVRLIHPIDMEAETRAKWGEVFTDYELLQPFEQLGRNVQRLEPEELDALLLKRNTGILFPHVRVLGLISSGWERGTPMDAGVVHWISKPLSDGEHELRIWLGDAGLWTGMGADQTDKPSISSVSVVRRDSATWSDNGELPMRAVPPSLMSDVLEVLERLVA